MKPEIEEIIESLIFVLEEDAGREVEILRKELFRAQVDYINAIDNPCQHQRTELLKVDGRISSVCKCCGKEISGADSAKRGLGGAYLLKPLDSA